MITEDLIEYIKSQISKSIPKDIIISRLIEVGWRIEDINEGFLQIESSVIQASPAINKIEENVAVDSSIDNLKEKEPEEIKKTTDLYRELPEIIDPSIIENINNITVDKIIPADSVVVTEHVVDKPIVNEPVTVSEPITPDVEPLKIWVPTNIKTKEAEEIKEEKQPVIIAPIIETPKVEIPSLETRKIEIQPLELPKEDIKIKEEPIVEELIPTININKTPISDPVLKVVNQIDKLPNMNSPVSQNRMSDILPKGAMLSSYSKDILASSNEKEDASLIANNRKHSFLKWGIIIVIICIIGGMLFAFMEGYLKIPWSNLSLSIVKKDPKIVILNTPSSVSKLKSYKTETNINISSPSLSNITTGLSSGEVVTSKDRDSISINLKGLVNNKLYFDYILNLKSSILKNDIISNWKYDGADLSVLVPDLSQILGEDAPTPATITMNSNQLGSIIPLFSAKTQDIIKKIDIYNIISSGIPLYVKNEVSTIFTNFIGGLEYTNKEDETIHGVDTYHYELTASRPLTKKFLSSLSSLFIIGLSSDQKTNLDEALGASTINSFEVWIGKNDDNLYQFKFTLNAPLSKVLGLNDSGIAGNEVKLDWVTTYYDLDIENNIVMSSEQINMEEFVNNIQDKKIKNIISSFGLQATSFKNAVGSYGLKYNPTGSCISPAQGSLFSPIGHTKGAGTAVGSISSSMNSLLSLTKGVGSCYSTSKAWALAAPLYTTPLSYYCASSEGDPTILTGPINGTVCSTPTPVSNVEQKVDTNNIITTTKTVETTRKDDSGPLKSNISIKADVTSTVDCGSVDCFQKKFVACQPATTTSDAGGLGAASYKIIGPVAGGCSMTFKYTKSPNPDWVNKEMTCPFDNKLSFEDSTSKVFNGIWDGSVICSGPFYSIWRDMGTQ